MAIRQVLHYPDPRLRQRATPVDLFDADLRTLIGDMFETMYASQGIGLAASQVDVHRRIVVIDVSADRTTPVCLINPEIIHREGVEEREEGCLSVPGVYELVERAERVTVRAQDGNGREFTLTADDLLAVCIQHELDHLEGRLFIDYLSRLKRGRIHKKLEKAQRVAL
ncbi:MAG: peptide deformylase [Gammaproteobacteria bacterium]|nr:peptide deformylase [Gammaproteobacteria bacterium]